MQRDKWVHPGMIFVGCILLGMGIGMIAEETGVGLFIGMGIGFIAMGILRRFEKGGEE